MTDFAARNRWTDVVVAQREAVDRLLSEDLAPAVLKVGIYVITRLSSYSRYAEPARVSEIAESTGLVRETVTRALRKLAKMSIIGWRGVRFGKSWIALAPHYLPVSETSEVTASTLSNTVTSEREVLNEKKTERESAPAGEEEPLTPAETHEADAGYAAFALCDHLFDGKPDPSVRMAALRHFRAVAPGRVREVLDIALTGLPARKIDSGKAYVAVWVRNAQEELAEFDRLDPENSRQQLLTRALV